jgi:hypothetical protein
VNSHRPVLVAINYEIVVVIDRVTRGRRPWLDEATICDQPAEPLELAEEFGMPRLHGVFVWPLGHRDRELPPHFGDVCSGLGQSEGRHDVRVGGPPARRPMRHHQALSGADQRPPFTEVNHMRGVRQRTGSGEPRWRRRTSAALDPHLDAPEKRSGRPTSNAGRASRRPQPPAQGLKHVSERRAGRLDRAGRGQSSWSRPMAATGSSSTRTLSRRSPPSPAARPTCSACWNSSISARMAKHGPACHRGRIASPRQRSDHTGSRRPGVPQGVPAAAPGRRSSCGTPVVVAPAAPRSSLLLRHPGRRCSCGTPVVVS